jgi:hypothetical protein
MLDACSIIGLGRSAAAARGGSGAITVTGPSIPKGDMPCWMSSTLGAF